MYFEVAGTYDLRSAQITGFEQLQISRSDITLLVDADALSDVTVIQSQGQVITNETALDLTGITVTGTIIGSDAPGGTTFTVDSKATAFQIIGGLGPDTLNAPTLTFTAVERDSIFGTASVETIIDQTGTYTAPMSGPNDLVLTPGDDILLPSAEVTQVTGNASTLTPGDSLDGGDGFDSLVLYGGGTFDLNSIATFANFEDVRVVNSTSGQAILTLRDGTTSDVATIGTARTNINLSGTAAAGTIQGGDGLDLVTLRDNATATTIDLGKGAGGQYVYLYNNASATTIRGNDNNEQVRFQGVGSADVATVELGGATDLLRIQNSDGWNVNIIADGGAGFDYMYFEVAGTYDLRSAQITGFEQLQISRSDITLLVDADALSDVTVIQSQGQVITNETALDLTGITVTGTIIGSDAPGGTTFTVDSKATAFQIIGGLGPDTLNAPTLTFTAVERDSIFGTASVETIIDQTGTYTAPMSGPNDLVLTPGDDILLPSAEVTQVTGNASTLTPGDSLDGGDGFDSLVLYGGGTFDLNSIATFANFEDVRVVNSTSGQAILTLRDGTTSDVATIGTARTNINLSGTAAAGTIQGGDGLDLVTLRDNATATTIDLGKGAGGQYVYLYNNASATTIRGNDNNEQVRFQGVGSADVATVELGGATDLLRIQNSDGWNVNIIADGGAGFDYMYFEVAGTYDLRSAQITGFEQLQISRSDITLLVDADALSDVTVIQSQGQVITNETALDLTGITVTGTIIGSDAPGGTTFTVDSKATAFQIIGGLGPDTLNAPTLTFTAVERDSIFGTASVETIIDQTGTYSILPPNSAPLAADDAVSGNEDTVISGNVLADNGNGADTDADGDTLTAALDTDVSSGTLTLNPDGSFTYTPNADFNGPDSFTYTIDDGKGGTDTATVDVTVEPVNDAPEATGSALTVAEGDERVLTLADFGYSDVDDDPLAYITLTSGSFANLFLDESPVSSGDLISLAQINDGLLALLPQPDTGGSFTINFTANDGTENSAQATLAVTVPPPTNTAPVLDAASFALDEGQTLAGTITFADPDSGDVHTFSLTVNAATDNALFTFDPTSGALNFVVPPDFEAPEDGDADNVYVVEVMVDDNNGGTDTGQFNVTINDVGEAVLVLNGPDPVDFGNIPLNASITNFLTVQNIGDGAATSIDTSDVDGPFDILGGSLTQDDVVAAGLSEQLSVRFTPDQLGALTETLEIQYFDGVSNQTLTRELVGTGTNQAPNAVDDTAATDEDAPITILAADLLANDTDPAICSRSRR